jgi:hypothetical protein
MQSNKRRQYTEEFKREAVRLVTDSGYGMSEAARNLGINTTMLGRWERLARLPFQLLDRHQILIQPLLSRLFAIGNNPGNHPILPSNDELPEGIECLYAVALHKVIVFRIVSPDDTANDQQLINVPVALDDFFCQ